MVYKRIKGSRQIGKYLAWHIPPNRKQAGAELGQAQVKLDDIVEVVVDVVVIAVVQVEV